MSTEPRVIFHPADKDGIRKYLQFNCVNRLNMLPSWAEQFKTIGFHGHSFNMAIRSGTPVFMAAVECFESLDCSAVISGEFMDFLTAVSNSVTIAEIELPRDATKEQAIDVAAHIWKFISDLCYSPIDYTVLPRSDGSLEISLASSVDLTDGNADNLSRFIWGLASDMSGLPSYVSESLTKVFGHRGIDRFFPLDKVDPGVDLKHNILIVADDTHIDNGNRCVLGSTIAEHSAEILEIMNSVEFRKRFEDATLHCFFEEHGKTPALTRSWPFWTESVVFDGMPTAPVCVTFAPGDTFDEAAMALHAAGPELWKKDEAGQWFFQDQRVFPSAGQAIARAEREVLFNYNAHLPDYLK